MSKGVAVLLLVCLVAAPAASAKAQPAVLFLADREAPVGEGNLSAQLPEGNVSSVRMVVPAPAPDLLTVFSAPQPGGTRLYGPAFAAVWPDQPSAPEGSTLRAVLRVAGESVAEVSVPAEFDPNSAPDPLAFVPPDPMDPEGAALHVVGQALPYVFTPGMLLYFGYVDVDVPANATVSVTFEIVSAAPVPVGSIVLKYDSMFTPSYVYMPWWVPDAPPTETTTSRPATPTTTPGPGPTTQPPAEDAGKDSPMLPLSAALLVLGALAVRRRL